MRGASNIKSQDDFTDDARDLPKWHGPSGAARLQLLRALPAVAGLGPADPGSWRSSRRDSLKRKARWKLCLSHLEINVTMHCPPHMGQGCSFVLVLCSEVHKASWWMLHYGGPTPKRHYAYSNSHHVGALSAGALIGWAKEKAARERQTGKKSGLVDKYVDK